MPRRQRISILKIKGIYLIAENTNEWLSKRVISAWDKWNWKITKPKTEDKDK